MNTIYLSEEHERFRRSVRDFVEKEVAPHADAWEEERRIPREIWRRMGEMGFLGISFPESLGGTGADLFYGLVFLEEIARSRIGGFCGAVTVQEFIATGAILRHGTDAQKQRFVVPSVEGRAVGAIAISEPDTGSDVAAIRTSARRDGDSWVLDGAKTWITNGVYADFYVVACRTDRDAGAHGISLFAFDADRPGIRTSKLRKMGWHSSDTAEIVFENVRVPLDALVGRENRGFSYIMETFALERIVAAAVSIGGAVVALEVTLRYMESRTAFGKPINRFQALRHRLADLFAELEAARQLVYHAAWLHERGKPAVTVAAMAKLLASELGKKVSDECLQFFGGYGYVEEYPMARFYRDARVGTIVAGTSEIMREIIARSEIDGMKFEMPEDDAEAGTVGSSGRPVENERHPEVAPAPGLPEPGKLPVTLPELFASLPSRFRPEKAAGFTGRFHFRFKDAEPSDWTVVVEKGACAASLGHEGTPDCVVTTTEKVYLAIERGEQNPQTAFFTGKVKVTNMLAMISFVKCFRPLFK